MDESTSRTVVKPTQTEDDLQQNDDLAARRHIARDLLSVNNIHQTGANVVQTASYLCNNNITYPGRCSVPNRFIRHNLTIFSVFDIFFILSVEGQIPTLLFVAQAIDILSNVTEQFVWSRIHLIYRRKRGSTHCITYKTVGTRSFQQSSMETHFHRHSRS